MTFALEQLGDCALLVQLGERFDAATNAHALATTARIRESRLPGIIDIAPAYASVCVRYDPLVWSDGSGTPPYAHIAGALTALVQEMAALEPQPKRDDGVIAEIPVCYDGDFGLDLRDVAGAAGLDTATVIARHCGATYRVAMLGFAPGFPYLFGLDPTLHMPRRASPRTHVPAGSVAIGGAQTGIYPRELPGGWNIIGRTPLRLFDAERDPPALFAPGQRVRFRAIDVHEFAALSR
jgi:KipI family sensor histidine kinase inhibitor